MYNFEFRPKRNHCGNNYGSFDRELEKFINGFTKSDSFAPPCEIVDEETFFAIGLDVPGLKREEIDIEVKDQKLIVSGERKSEKANVLQSERNYGKFSRVFSLPANLKTDSIEAKYENGVLEIRLPKEEKVAPKKIQITGLS